MKITLPPLTPAQMMQGAMAGVLRQVSALKNKRVGAYGSSGENDWQYHIEGCLGELAFARWVDRFWDGKINDLSAGDVGKFEVRTAPEDWKRLIMHDEDIDYARFYFVTGRNGNYVVHGWILGSDAKDRKYWKDPVGGRPAYFVPKSALHPKLTVVQVPGVKEGE